MTPLIKKTLFRIKKLNKPFSSEQGKRNKFLAKSSIRVITAVVTILIVIGVVFTSSLPVKFLLNEGDIASDDIYAPFDFSYRSGVDETQTRLMQEDAEARVPEIYNISDKALKDSQKKIEEFFRILNEEKFAEAAAEEAGVDLSKRIKDISGIDLNENDIEGLISLEDSEQFKAHALKALDAIYSQPIISDDDKNRIELAGQGLVSVYDKPGKNKDDYDIYDIYTTESVLRYMDQLLSEDEIIGKKDKLLLAQIVSKVIAPNLVFNKDETIHAIRNARSRVEPVYINEERLKGEVIIRKGQKIAKSHIAQMDAISSLTAPGDTFSQLLGIAVIVCILLFATFIFIRIFEYKIYDQEHIFVLISIFIILTAVSARAIALSPLPSLSLPLSAAPMLLTLLVGGPVSVIVLIIISAIAALVAGIQFNVFLVSLIGGITAICTVYNARSRSDIIRSGFYVGIMNFIVISAIGIMSNFETAIFLKQASWGMASGIVAAAITMIFLPVFESLFKITTDIRLLELADLNHPLLKEMVTKATGTYHHSIIVANLAEAASEAIGANSLLCRIGSYYHDIGKIEKSEYFAENEQVPSDSHKGLSPTMSSLVITNHVKDGEELAEKYKLGTAIKDIIKQHHGTNIMTYFYHQALEQKQEGQVVSDESFRYPGPKPQSKESAIVMLADSVEAASRTVQEQTPQKFKELVRKIINNKFLDRQLDECDLTLKDISRISDSFVKILTGTYHSRVEYPDLKQSKNENSPGR
jgi:cyclic-di-AMP phosphodiesterase PgpH